MLHSLSTLHSEKLRSVLKAMYFLVHSASIKQDEESQKLLDSLSDDSYFHDMLDAIIYSDEENRLVIEYATKICAKLYEDDIKVILLLFYRKLVKNLQLLLSVRFHMLIVLQLLQ